MFLVKFTDEEWKNKALSGESVRIGSVQQYREINDPTFRDSDEGEGRIAYKSKSTLNPKEFNKLFATDGFTMHKDWSIITNGIPLFTEKSVFNPLIYSCSLIRRKADIPKIAKHFNKSHWYFLGDVNKFISSVSDSIKNELIKMGIEGLAGDINKIQANPVMGRVIYTNEKKNRFVGSDEIKTHRSKTFKIEPYFQKPLKYNIESEFRIIWILSLGSIDQQNTNFISFPNKTLDLSLNNHGLRNKAKSIKKILTKSGKIV